jgi:hypothetical protein
MDFVVVRPSLRPLALVTSFSLALAATDLATSPAAAEPTGFPRGKAADLAVMQVSLKDAVPFSWGFQGQTQGAGTPNAIGIGGFLPLSVRANSVLFLDALVNVNLPDIDRSSSIINTEVVGTTLSTSTRLGYRWFNDDRSWWFGLTTGYDSRPMATGQPDTGIAVTNPQTVFFQQLAAGLEAVSDSWSLHAYALVPVGTTNAQLNSVYQGGALETYGLDVGYAITPDIRFSLGYYYQDGDIGTADGSGVLGKLAYRISSSLTLAANLSYDQAFATRVSADLNYRFGSRGDAAPARPPSAVMQALSAPPGNRDVRVADGVTWNPRGEMASGGVCSDC